MDISALNEKQRIHFIENYKPVINNLGNMLSFPFKHKLMLFKLTNRKKINSMIKNTENFVNKLRNIKNSNQTVDVDAQLAMMENSLALLHSVKRASNNYKKLKHLRTHFKNADNFFPYYKELFDVNNAYVGLLSDIINKYNELTSLLIKNPDKRYFYSFMDKEEAEKLAELIVGIGKFASKSQALIDFLVKKQQSSRHELDKVFNDAKSL